MQTMIIKSGQGDYAVYFLENLDSLLAQLRTSTGAVVIIDRNVAEYYPALHNALTAVFPTLMLEATEEEKTFSGVARVITFLQQHNATRQTELLVIGGGIIQDIASFAAHIYYRGIRWTLVPTTLLSMSDSCIGAKCGINFGEYKNQLGFYHAPRRVFICTQFLDTLTQVDILSGYGEIVKLALTGSAQQFDGLMEIMAQYGLRNDRLLTLLHESLLVKKGLIEEDEYDKGQRRILNYGHTFGHALETITDHQVPHGIAIAWGMDIANFVAMRLGVQSEETFRTIHAILMRYFAFSLTQSYTSDDLALAMRRDKKVQDGQLVAIFLQQIGQLGIHRLPFDAFLEETLEEYHQTQNIFHCEKSTLALGEQITVRIGGGEQ